MQSSLKILLAVLIFFSFGFIVRAQIPGQSIDLIPSIENPAPGEELTITARSYSLDINAANITWTVNGVQVQKGIGLTKYTLKAPAMGKRTSVNVTAVSISGQTAVGKLSVGSGTVDLIIETDGYVPPLYKGKIPVVYQNTIKIIAVPHLARADGTEYDPKTLVYKWKKGSQALESNSGYGKQSLTLVGEVIPRELNINVTVYNREGTVSTSGYLPIEFTSPSISFYVDDPLYGPLYNKAINGTLYIGGEREVGVVSAPFGFSKSGLNLQYDWQINGEEDPNLSQSNSVIFRAPANGSSGASFIDLSVQNTRSMLQSARMTMKAVYQAWTNSSSTQIQF